MIQETQIDSLSIISYTLKLKELHNRIDLFNKSNHLYSFIKKQSSNETYYKVKDKKNNKMIYSYTTGAYQEQRTKEKKMYLKISFDGLKTYSSIDFLRRDTLLNLLDYLKHYTNEIFRIQSIDIAHDVINHHNNVLLFKNKQGNNINKQSLKIDKKTFYLEKIKHKFIMKKNQSIKVIDKSHREKMMVSSYTYDKAHKENINTVLTRVEISIKKNTMKNIVTIDKLKKYLDNYNIISYASASEANKNKKLLNAGKKNKVNTKYKRKLKIESDIMSILGHSIIYFKTDMKKEKEYSKIEDFI